VNDELDGGGRAAEAGKDSVLVEYGIRERWMRGNAWIAGPRREKRRRKGEKEERHTEYAVK
jgi:hypothetical protein